MARRVIIDTDGGVDDALAILLALASPEIEVVAITTVAGNVSVEQATTNVQRIVELSGSQAPVLIAPGCDRALLGEVVVATSIHGDDGLGNLTEYTNTDGTARYGSVVPLADPPHAVEVLMREIRHNPEDLTIVGIGPMTNLAVVARIDPVSFARVGTIVQMGGAVDLPGNVAPYAEFNMWADPDAAHVALRANPNITMVGLDASVQAFLPREVVDKWARLHPTDRTMFVRDCTRMYMDFYRTYENVDGCYLHDPLAVAVAIAPDIVTRRTYGFDMQLTGPTRGMLVADRRPRAPKDPEHAVAVAWEVDTERLLGQLLPERLGHVSGGAR